MPSKLPTLANWFSVPGNARALDVFLESATGKRWLETLQYEFRADPGSVVVIPGVSYTEVHAFRNSFREGIQKTIDTTLLMSIPREKKERIPDAGWATRPLQDERESINPPAKKTK